VVAVPKTNVAELSVERVKGEKRSVKNVLEAQIALDRLGISSGCIDGSFGLQTQRALEAYQIYQFLPISGQLDAETMEHLKIEEPVFTSYTVSSEDLERLQPLSETWLGKSQQTRLEYETVLELVAEKFHAHENLVRNLNPGLNWKSIPAGTAVKVPRVDRVAPRRASFVRIHLFTKTLQVFDAKTNLLAHFPCSIAQRVDKRPIGMVQVTKVAANPTYLFNPEIFPESAEARQLGRKLTLPPGPNSPVGLAWIGLDRPGYGIHGTPRPEQVGRTESHGCFRLANWNAQYLLQMSWMGMPVYIQR
jgi:lipoprotein-anchoring transpeptidase ErfK/SrfK